jgi:hypothetical protein
MGSIPDEITGFFNLPNPSSHTMALISTKTLNKNSYQESSGVGEGRNVEASVSHNCIGLHGLLQGQVYCDKFYNTRIVPTMMVLI